MSALMSLEGTPGRGRWAKKPGGVAVWVVDDTEPWWAELLIAVLHGLDVEAGRMARMRTMTAGKTTCEACGCLLFGVEACPGCRLAAEGKKLH